MEAVPTTSASVITEGIPEICKKKKKKTLVLPAEILNLTVDIQYSTEKARINVVSR